MSGERWLSVSVYRNAELTSDCTAGGVTSRHVSLYVPHPNGNHEDPPEELCLRLRSKGDVGNFVPEGIVQAEGVWSMFGGNFVWATDSRFRSFYGDRPVAVHDRVERLPLPGRGLPADFLEGARLAGLRRSALRTPEQIAGEFAHLVNGNGKEQAQGRGAVAAVFHFEGKSAAARFWCDREGADWQEFLMQVGAGRGNRRIPAGTAVSVRAYRSKDRSYAAQSVTLLDPCETYGFELLEAVDEDQIEIQVYAHSVEDLER